MTREIQVYTRIGFTNAGGVSQAKINGDFSRECNGIKDTGIFHQLPQEMREALLTVALEDAKPTRAKDKGSIGKTAPRKAEKGRIVTKEKASQRQRILYRSTVFP